MTFVKYFLILNVNHRYKNKDVYSDNNDEI